MRMTASKDIEDLLNASGVPWRVDEGTKHLHIVVGGRLAAILPKGRQLRWDKGRGHKNVVAQVRRAIRACGGETANG